VRAREGARERERVTYILCHSLSSTCPALRTHMLARPTSSPTPSSPFSLYLRVLHIYKKNSFSLYISGYTHTQTHTHTYTYPFICLHIYKYMYIVQVATWQSTSVTPWGPCYGSTVLNRLSLPPSIPPSLPPFLPPSPLRPQHCVKCGKPTGFFRSPRRFRRLCPP
jgi:hypothetical protein